MDLRISEHISYDEVVYSNTAIKYNIKNEPNLVQLCKIRLGAEFVFEPLRKYVGGAIKITSCFRSPELNEKLNGSSSSQHLANNGCAYDLDDTYKHKTNAEMFYYIKDNLDFDQLIWEFGTDKNPNWVHVSYVAKGNRKQVLKAIKDSNGKTKYVSFD
jgi:hypothetical protein